MHTAAPVSNPATPATSANPAALLARVALQLAVRHVLAALGHGAHAGRERGDGIEFAEYRAYAPGDDWRRIDWKLLARTDRYFLREAERDSHVAVWLWLDATASMAEPSRTEPALTKLWFARTLLACIAAIAQRQGDAFGLVVCQDGREHLTPAARGEQQLRRVTGQLERVQANGVLAGAGATGSALPFARTPGMIFAVSDFLDWPSSQGQALLRLRHMRHDVRALCLHTQAEQDASFGPDAAFTDPEQPGSMYRYASDARGVYRQQRDEHFARVMGHMRRHDLPALSACIEQAPDAVLRAWLRKERRV